MNNCTNASIKQNLPTKTFSGNYLGSAPASITKAQEVKKTNVKRFRYLPVFNKFIIAICVSSLWTLLSTLLAVEWARALRPSGSGIIFDIFAWTVIAGIALIPGFMNAFIIVSLVLDKRPARMQLVRYPSLSILIAAYNEESSIISTIESIASQKYPGKLEVIVVNDGSKDRTVELVEAMLNKYSWLQLEDLKKNVGKANALNVVLAKATHDLVLTIDGDSYLHHNALTNIVERYLQDPPTTRAVAGAVMVRNSRESWMTRAQEWDYFHGIAAIKRVQSLYQGTMVAQGAFSIYDKNLLIDLGGWPDRVGEDIVLSWGILKQGYRIGYSEDAILFTNAPATLKQFSQQRQRWARGMVEAFRYHPQILFRARMSTLFVWFNLLFPMLDMIFTLIFIPGVILALMGYYWIAGVSTLMLLPLAMAMNYLMYRVSSHVYKKSSLKVRKNHIGFLIYSIFYSLIMQPVSLLGYLSEVINAPKTWGTK